MVTKAEGQRANSVARARSWHPIAAGSDLPLRHVFQAELNGREFAVWRADDGYLNVWENRCLHRGVRLSIGINDGRELKCQYHGWRYANRTAGCTYIPAHPADAPARTITNRTYPSFERYGLVWSTLDGGDADIPELPGFEAADRLVLRGIAVNAPAERVVASLRSYAFQPNASIDGSDGTTTVEMIDTLAVQALAREAGDETRALFFVQPVDPGRCVIRGVLEGGAASADRMAILRHHNERLSALRASVEVEAFAEPISTPPEPAYAPVAPELAEMPGPPRAGRRGTITVSVARKWPTAEGIVAFELRPLGGLLPTSQPGAHIDVHLPNGLIRQYSIVNAPGETDRYVIGVKREAASAGGSIALHDTVREGDLFAISEPRNNFPLRRDATKTLLIAGGIGATPLLAMAQTLNHSNLTYEFHYLAQNEGHLAFPDRLAVLGEGLSTHLGLGPEQSLARLRELLSGYRPGMHVYLCGPGPMLEAAIAIAADAGWPESAVHFEFFKNTHAIDVSSAFEVALARSLMTLSVPAGKSILQVIREAGIDMPSSCEQGACGTCMATVIEGEPLHQDVYLHESERRRGDKIMTCVSRAKSARLVLDL